MNGIEAFFGKMETAKLLESFWDRLQKSTAKTGPTKFLKLSKISNISYEANRSFLKEKIKQSFDGEVKV